MAVNWIAGLHPPAHQWHDYRGMCGPCIYYTDVFIKFVTSSSLSCFFWTSYWSQVETATLPSFGVVIPLQVTPLTELRLATAAEEREVVFLLRSDVRRRHASKDTSHLTSSNYCTARLTTLLMTHQRVSLPTNRRFINNFPYIRLYVIRPTVSWSS